MRALLDVNVLIALLDASHLHHRSATAWLAANAAAGWASCPITQAGCIRIMSQPGYPAPLPAGQVAERLAEAASQPWHAFWPDDVDLLGEPPFDWTAILGSRQVTDAYLLALAVRKGGRLATFDRNVPLAAVSGASPAHLEVLAA
jgi:toxin-antitoxin system PIN domain toxin